MSKTTKRWIYAGVLCACATGGVIAYTRGYRITDHFSIGQVGTLDLQIPVAHTSVFVDNSLAYSTTKDDEDVTLKLSPSTHTIIVSNKTYFPWTKDISIASAGTSTANPLFVFQNPSGMIITPHDAEYEIIKDSILNYSLPTKDKPLISQNGSTKIWVEDNAILTQNTSTSSEAHIVIQPDTIVKNVSFYKDRSDAIIFSTDNTVDVIETDTNGTQNFMPIYKGTDPSFVSVSTSTNFLYIQDGNTLLQVNI